MLKRTDKTRNECQARRQEREKRWLMANGWRSWKALHTALMDSVLSGYRRKQIFLIHLRKIMNNSNHPGPYLIRIWTLHR
jgi:hypothetical protein